MPSIDVPTEQPPVAGSAGSPAISRPLGAVAGVVGAGFGLATAELIAGVDKGLRSPVLDVGDRVVDRAPVWAKNLAIDWFGTSDKVALLAGIGAVLMLYATAVGILARRRRAYGDAGIAVFVAVGVVSSIATRTGTNWVAPIPSVIGGVVAAGALRWLLSLADTRGQSGFGTVHPGHRRRFLAGAAATVVGAGVVSASGRRLQSRFDASVARSRLTLPMAANPLPPVPATAQADAAAPFITSNAEFYRIDTALVVPQVDVETWALSVGGLVEQELSLSYRDLIDRPLVESDITLTCVSNTVGGDLTGTARWLGVRLDELLDEAGIDPTADQIVGRSVDGYTCGFPTAALDGRDALVVIGMNGELLPLEHGYPARLIVPGIYGYASATKWLERIELTTFESFDHYWVPRGYAAKAPIKTQSRIDTPRGLDRIPPGSFVLGGVAWAQTVGISAVEIRVDEGPWQTTSLATEVNDTTWRQWSQPWDATPGRHTIEVRAIDATGAIQTPERSEPLPNGASGHHKIVVLVDKA